MSEDIMDRGQRVDKTVEGREKDERVYHGETGTTYGGVGFSPLYRTIHFTPVIGTRRSKNGGARISR